MFFFFLAGTDCQSLRGHVECISRRGGVEAEGCSRDREGESHPPVPDMCSQLAGKGKQLHLALFPAPRPSTFIHDLVSGAFSSSIVTGCLYKGFMPPYHAKYPG